LLIAQFVKTQHIVNNVRLDSTRIKLQNYAHCAISWRVVPCAVFIINAQFVHLAMHWTVPNFVKNAQNS